MSIFLRLVDLLGVININPSKDYFSYPTTFTMPNETYNKQLADVSSAQYKALFKKLEMMVILHSPRCFCSQSLELCISNMYKMYIHFGSYKLSFFGSSWHKRLNSVFILWICRKDYLKMRPTYQHRGTITVLRVSLRTASIPMNTTTIYICTLKLHLNFKSTFPHIYSYFVRVCIPLLK